MAKWLAHLPFTSKVAGSNLSKNFSIGSFIREKISRDLIKTCLI